MSITQIRACDEYLSSRTGKYEWRRIRYRAALDVMQMTRSLVNEDTLIDVGAGWTELDYCLRTEGDWRGRYIPIDGGIDGVDLDAVGWSPPREAEWMIGLEIIEHLEAPGPFIAKLKHNAAKGVVLSTPNPRTTDVLGMDHTHQSIIYADALESRGFTVEERSFYGQENDSLLAWWVRN